MTAPAKSSILHFNMKPVAWCTILSVLFLSFHVLVDHHPVGVVTAEGGLGHGHFHSDGAHHSHSSGGHHHSSDAADSGSHPSSHDPAAHDHEDTLLRAANGALNALTFVCILPIQSDWVDQSTLKLFFPTFDVNPPPPQGKIFLSKQSFLI